MGIARQIRHGLLGPSSPKRVVELTIITDAVETVSDPLRAVTPRELARVTAAGPPAVMAAPTGLPNRHQRKQQVVSPIYSSISSSPSSASSSPSTITPSLSTSNSASNSSGSPPPPETPVARPGRSTSRYPDLGRVPLHRRGKSRTYERLEDLLKEAGYKETRVFTPETERLERQAEQTRADSQPPRSLRGVGSVVGFIAGLIPGNATLTRSSSLREPSGKSRNDLPSRSNSLAARQSPHQAASHPQRGAKQNRLPRSPVPSRPATPGSVTSVECAGPTPRASYQSPRHLSNHRQAALYSYANDSHTSIHSQRRVHNAPSLSHRNTTSSSLLPHKHSETILHPQPSRAGAYLRHMASVASIPQRPSSTPAHQYNLNDDDDIAPRRRGNGEGEQDAPPPLPKTWLETVARAVVFGGVGYVGGPQQDPPKPSDGRGRSTDRQSLRPPELVAQMSRRRSRRSEGEVSRTRVVCHSAPSSRPSSRSRDRGDSRENDAVHRSVVPSLARTKVEGDTPLGLESPAPTKVRKPKAKGKTTKRFVGGWGHEIDSSSAEELSADDDDGELDLAKILVPPKRQNSIRSLRKHLGDVNVNGEPSGRRPITRVHSAVEYGHWDGYSEQPAWDAKRREPLRRGSLEEDDDAHYGASFLVDRSTRGGTKSSRRGLPTMWSS